MELLWSDDITAQMAKLANLDVIAPDMLKAAAPIAVDALKQEVGKHRSNMAAKHLADSVKAGKIKKRKSGGYGIDVSFEGYDTGHGASGDNKNKVPQMQKAVALEYGTAKQAATPFLNKAARNCQTAVSTAMQEVLEKVVDT